MSPRLHSVRERKPLDLGMVVELTQGSARSLFLRDVIAPDRFAGTGIIQSADYAYPTDGTWVFMDMSIDRSDVEVEFKIGDKPGYRFCGPWMRGLRMDLLSVLHDMVLEGRTPDNEMLKVVKAELAQSKGMLLPLVIPVRQVCYAYARLLPNAPEGWATIHFRTLVTRDIQ